jgi:hypothetical protein
MKTPLRQPLPFIVGLRKESYSFADQFTLTTIAVALLAIGWDVSHRFGWFGAAPAALLLFAPSLCIGWFVFKAIAALIDYTIYAVAHAGTELVGEFFESIAAAQSIPADVREANPVSYLDYLLKRTPDVSKPGAA